jgi:rhamnosyltransferase
MRMTESDVVAFVNADAIPLHDDALATLIAPLADAAATYARQVARSTANARTRADYARAFGDRALALRHAPMFSMAASALRRDVWQALPFDESLRYSEDADWVYRAAAMGYRIDYVPDARFEHSHDYDLRGSYKRRAGEGTADAAIYRLGRPSLIGDLVKPLAGSLVRDARAGLLSPSGAIERIAQAAGYYVGRWQARR